MGSRICLVTIHGIGFQQPPIYTDDEYCPVIAGYADRLHEHLSARLGQVLSDDPGRKRHVPGQNGPIYVQSVWPGNSYQLENGRSRLGMWDGQDRFKINPFTVYHTPAPLYAGTQATITHVALVYSQEEGIRSHTLDALQASLLTLATTHNYAHMTGLARSLLLDFKPLVQHILDHQGINSDEPAPSLRIRQDSGFSLEDVQDGGAGNSGALPTGFLAILRQLENDVAAYVYSNKLRERIRGFVLDALLRLACRSDVDGILINAHSNGTVIAFDVLRELPPFAAAKIRGLITAGSPLRKYTKLFNWGQILTTYPPLTTWLNLFDAHDPVADPLFTPTSWLIGDQDPIQQVRYQPSMQQSGTFYRDPDPSTIYLYQALNPNTGKMTNMPIQDLLVDNLKYSFHGGLKAHNYWDNVAEFVPVLTEMLKSLL